MGLRMRASVAVYMRLCETEAGYMRGNERPPRLYPSPVSSQRRYIQFTLFAVHTTYLHSNGHVPHSNETSFNQEKLLASTYAKMLYMRAS